MPSSGVGRSRVCPLGGGQYYNHDCEMKMCLEIDRCWPPESDGDDQSGEGMSQGIFQF